MSFYAIYLIVPKNRAIHSVLNIVILEGHRRSYWNKNHKGWGRSGVKSDRPILFAALRRKELINALLPRHPVLIPPCLYALS